MALDLKSRDDSAGLAERLSAANEAQEADVSDEELEAQAELEEQRNMAREARRQVIADAKSKLKGMAKSEAKVLAKKATKRGLVMFGEWLGASGAAAAATGAGTIALILAVVIVFFMIFVSTLYMTCTNQAGLTGFAARTVSFVMTFGGSEKVCDTIAQMTGVPRGSTVATQTTPRLPNVAPAQVTPFDGTTLVPIGNSVPVASSTRDPRLTACMLARVQRIFALAQAQNIQMEITDAYRHNARTSRGGLSAHARGEAVDIAIRPTRDWIADRDFANKIDAVVVIARAQGFDPPPGDTKDEYRDPDENATGGHIHIEFNIPATGTYCT